VNVFVNEMRTRIDAYFEIVLRNVRDSIPKAIGFFLVKKSQDVLQFELYNQVNSNKQLAAALGEPARITERRKALTEVLNTLKNSVKVLQRDPDISANTVGDEELEAALKAEYMDNKRAASMAQGKGP
jgi:dynamin 1-like protein